MNIGVVGLNHRSAPIEVREKISFPGAKLGQALQVLKRDKRIREGLILSTCNRVEIYAESGEPGLDEHLTDFLSSFHSAPKTELKKHLYAHNGLDALRHLFRVSSSLDSQILGENQILGQIKTAYFTAKEAGTVAGDFSFIFEEAIKMGKRARSETQIGVGAVSVSTAAVELARKIFNDFKGKKILIIGAGKIGELAVRHLYVKGAQMVLVANRTFSKAEKLAREFQGQAISFDKFEEALTVADIVISSVSAPHLLVKKEDARQLIAARKQKPIFFIDLGVPRNIDPEINGIDNVYVYNLDDLKKVKDANLKERLNEAEKIEGMIEVRMERICPKIKEMLER